MTELQHPAPNEPDCECEWRSQEDNIDPTAPLILCARHERMLRPLRWDTLAEMLIDMMAAVHQYAALLAAPGAAPAEGRALDVDRLATADGYRQGWAAACETVLREVEDLPDRSGLGDASLSRGAVVGIVRDALSTLE